jgi:hypothetical protein
MQPKLGSVPEILGDTTEQYCYASAIRQLQDCGHISLLDMQKLSCAEVDCLFEEIKYWLIYGRDINFIHDLKKLSAECRWPRQFSRANHETK